MSGMSKREPAVTVIIPTYNSSGTLRLTLQTVLWQDLADFEVWVVGDGCTDDSENVIASFADDRLHWVNLPSNSGGPSLPRNEGLRHAKGRYIAYLGHDDLWFPWHLSELVDCIETSNADFVYSLGAALGPDGLIGSFAIPRRPKSPNENISPSNWLHRKCLTDAIGSWPPDAKLSDDLEFLQRVLAAKVKLAFRRQLSVLKFPASEWRMYSLKNDFPQTRYVKAMHRDPAALRDELLLELATLMSRRGFVLYEHRGQLYKSLLDLAARATYIYGCNRWPVNRLLYGRWRRKAGLG
jgi:glycosyltransferase involved in cell wall biosynthesis